MEMAWILIFHVPHNIHNVIAQRTDKQIKQEKMLPTRKLNSQSWLPDFFNDFFENGALDKSGSSVPAINVIEEERGYKLELAAPGTTKEDFKVHINRDGNLEI